jgi:hypothetical protein
LGSFVWRYWALCRRLGGVGRWVVLLVTLIPIQMVLSAFRR